MIVQTEADFNTLMEFIHGSELLAYDTETTGLNVRKDTVIGFGISDHISSFYIPLFTYKTNLVYTGLPEQLVKAVLSALSKKKLIMFNASFDARITKANLGIDLLPALHADVLLLKHTCDEEFPFGLKEIATKLWGTEVKKEKEEMLASIKANGGTAKEYYKADTSVLAKYCEQDCLLTFKLFNHYGRQLKIEGLEDFYYRDEVMPLYREVTIPMEESGVQLDVAKIQQTHAEISEVILRTQESILATIAPMLSSVFTPWFLNKDYPMKTATGKAPAWSKKYSSQYEAWRAENTGPMFNLQSKFHLKKLFFDTMQLKPLSKTPTGMPQVDEDFLEANSQIFPWILQLIEYNKLSKIRSTYVERFMEEAEDGIFYPSFMQHRTVSGRYAGDLQQLPRPSSDGVGSVGRFTSVIREFIIAAPGSKLVSADYEQLEPRVFCHVSGDTALSSIFTKKLDFYSEIARMTEGLAEVNKEQRQKAKSYALGIAYGMTGYKLKFELGCTDEVADALVEKYLTAFPGLRKWMNDSKTKAIAQGFVKTQSGRMRHLPRTKELAQRYGRAIEDSLELWRRFNSTPELYAKVKSDYKEYKNLQNNAINFQVQGLAASIVNRAAIAINRKLIRQSFKAKLVMQVHDELVYEVPEEELEEVCQIIRSKMERTTQLTVPLITVPQVGNNFRECK